MMNVWVQLIWITICATESFLYSIFKFYLASDEKGKVCSPTKISNEGNNILEFFTKFSAHAPLNVTDLRDPEHVLSFGGQTL